MNFDQAFEQYRRYLRQNNYSKSTISSYCTVIKRYFGNKNLDELTQKDLDNISLELVEKYQSNGNKIRYSAINLFCDIILKRGRNTKIKKNRLYLKIPKSEAKNKDILTNEQVEKIIEVAKTKNKVVYALIQTLYHCGLRKSEVSKLNLEDINFETMELSLRNTKTGDEIVTMTTSVAEAIKDYILYERKPSKQDEKALFVNSYGNRIGEHFLRIYLKECTIEAGIKRRVYPHMLRAACITHLLNKGVNPLTVQRHARHKNFTTTMAYNRPTQQQMKADIERVFSVKQDLTDQDRGKIICDKYLHGEITLEEMHAQLEITQPKQLKPGTEFPGYV